MRSDMQFPSPSRHLSLYQENQRPGDALAPGDLHDRAVNMELKFSRTPGLETGDLVLAKCHFGKIDALANATATSVLESIYCL